MWGGGGVSGQTEGELSLPLGHRQGTDSGAVFPVGDRDVHKPQDRARQPLAVVWHPINSD